MLIELRNLFNRNEMNLVAIMNDRQLTEVIDPVDLQTIEEPVTDVVNPVISLENVQTETTIRQARRKGQS